MSKFVTGTALSFTIEKIISNAQERLLLLAPGIHIAPRLKEEIRRKKTVDALQVIVVFGSNGLPGKLAEAEEAINLFKELPNVAIYFEEKLNAFYYASEGTAILTSAALSNYNGADQLDAGMVLFGKGMLNKLAGTIGNSLTETEKSSWELAAEFADDIIGKSQELFRKTPQYDKGFMNLSKKYSRSVVETDKTAEFFASRRPAPKPAPTSSEATEEGAQNQATDEAAPPIPKPAFTTEYKNEGAAPAETTPAPGPAEPAPVQTTPAGYEPYVKPVEESLKPGFCIRTGSPMHYNPRAPMSQHALRDWQREGDPEFPENYCHFSGEPSYGQTSMNRPILAKNLRKAQGYS